jgi:hypothetical protein
MVEPASLLTQNRRRWRLPSSDSIPNCFHALTKNILPLDGNGSDGGRSFTFWKIGGRPIEETKARLMV